jgi:hypothetical protein
MAGARSQLSKHSICSHLVHRTTWSGSTGTVRNAVRSFSPLPIESDARQAVWVMGGPYRNRPGPPTERRELTTLGVIAADELYLYRAGRDSDCR